MKQLTAYDERGAALFHRHVMNKAEARLVVLYSGFTPRIAWVRYNGANHTLEDVKSWAVDDIKNVRDRKDIND